MERRLLYFLHIPKTAGMTLNDLLDAQYHQRTICPAVMPDSVSRIPPERLNQYLLFHGHFDYGFQHRLIENPILVTFMRDPVDRILSFYAHALRTEWENTVWAHHFHSAHRQNLEGYIRDGDERVQLELRNGQARRLSAPLDETLGWSDDRLYETAKAHLDECLVVGFAETFDQSYQAICRAFGWQAAEHYPIKNVSQRERPRRDHVAPSVLKTIEDNNQVDRALYDYARRLSARQTRPLYPAASAGGAIGESVLRNRLRIAYDFDQPLNGTGWHGRERDRTYGWFRWTGPEAAGVLEFAVEPDQPYDVSVELIAEFRPAMSERARLIVNDRPVTVEQECEGGILRFHGQIEAEWVKEKRLRLAIQVPEATAAGAGDIRRIGVAVRKVVIESVGKSRQTMPNERVIEIPWALSQLPQAGLILDVGSCEASYLHNIPMPDRVLHCLDMRDCREGIPANAVFHHQDLIGNDLPRRHYDAVLVVSTLEHIGLPHYEGEAFPNGDRLALAEIYDLLKPDGVAIVTVPAGGSRLASWYRQYSPKDLKRLFAGWETQITYWGYVDGRYQIIDESRVREFDYDYSHGAGAVAGIIARPRA